MLPTADAIEREIKHEKYVQRYKKILKSTFYTLVVVAAVAVLVATLVLPVLQISGESMEPTLYNGEIVVLIKTTKFERGELCAFSYQNKILIKRVIGVGGDVIKIDADGNVYVNGYIIDEPYVKEKALGECDIEFPYTVPENEYFVLGDSRAGSVDSRSSVIGCIPYDRIVGKLVVKIWPLKAFSRL